MEPVIDWKHILAELAAAGYTQRSIAQEIGVTQPTISCLVSGTQRDLAWTKGERLRLLHARVCGASTT